MRYPVMRLCCILLTFGSLLSPVAAETSQERVALSLSGQDCSSQRPSIGAALAQIPGVSHVDLESVPDHVLVDVAQGAVTPEELSAAATRSVTPGTQCLVEIMKSCISASLSPSHR
ncbi:MAG: hypothetical protein HY348_02760 [Nitrospira defluvii]|nr:hypothetical protein [Nitrospira defluvii]